MSVSGVYKIVNIINMKIYVGSSISIDSRWADHRRKLKINKHGNKHLQGAYNQNKECWKYEIVEEVKLKNTMSLKEKKTILESREQHFMDLYKFSQ